MRACYPVDSIESILSGRISGADNVIPGGDRVKGLRIASSAIVTELLLEVLVVL